MLDPVRTGSQGAVRRYHHGDLRAALVEAGLELTRSGGPRALVLRDATRRAGVSPNAAYRHFADREALLAAVRDRVHADAAGRMAHPAAGDARAALRAVGLGYIGFALAEPGWFEVAFGDVDPARVAADGAPPTLPAPLARLLDALDALVDTGELAAADRPGAEWPCWSAVHGFALLVLHGPLRHHGHAELLVHAERTVDAVVTGLLDRRAPRTVAPPP